MLALLAGCVGQVYKTDVVPAGTKPIMLSQVHTNILKEGVKEGPDRTIVFLPAGVYQPDFQAKQGVFYRAPGRLAMEVSVLATPKYAGPTRRAKDTHVGGIVIPPPTSKHPFVVWFELRDPMTDYLTPMVFEVVQPIPYQDAP